MNNTTFRETVTIIRWSCQETGDVKGRTLTDHHAAARFQRRVKGQKFVLFADAIRG